MKSKTLFAHYTKRNLLLQYLSFLITRPQNAPLAPSRPPLPAHRPCPSRSMVRSRGASSRVPWCGLACPMVRSRGVSSRIPWCGPVAVGRDVPIAPPRHRRGAWLCTPRPAPAHPLAPSPTRPLSPFPPRHHTHILPGRRDGDIAPYRHYTRDFRMRIIRTMRCAAWNPALHACAPRPPPSRPVAALHARVPWR